ncbi:MAG: Gfo/Idh/MocA family oxidoreductase [Chthoniobacteraceae bacterium]
MNRRTFLKSSIAAAAAVSLPARTYAQSPGANSDIRVAVIGFNGRGNDHIKGYLGQKGVRVVALCDVDTSVLTRGKDQLQKKGAEVETYQDIRKLLENKDIDAISIATPNHWHSLAGIWGMQAGKDVYVEKPVSHNVWEGRQLVKAADAHQKIVQMGVQSRSAIGLASALEWLQDGPLGKLQYVRGLCYKPRPSIGQAEGPLQIPEQIDFDLWCGPASNEPIHRKKLHYDWHWVWNTGNGDLGNQGIHQMDIARRFLGEDALSPKVFAVGGRLGYKDDGETPNSMFIVHDYEKAPLIFEVRGLPEKSGSKSMDKYRGASIGVVVQYEKGHVLCPNYNDALVFDESGQEVRKFNRSSPVKNGPTTENHYENFITAVRSRKPSELTGKILDGHISSGLCHTGNISYLVGKKSSPEVMREKMEGNKEALDSLARLLAHLEANEVAVEQDQLTMGEFLKMDPATERFVGNAEANALLTREYRKPFVVPATV